MRKSQKVIIFVFGCLLLFLLSKEKIFCQELPLVIRGGKCVIRADDPPLENAVIIIQGDKIKFVHKEGEAEIPTEARLIEAMGKTVLPGIIDVHIHSLSKYENLKSLLTGGVTSVRDLASRPEWIFEAKRREREERVSLPRLFVAGPIVTVPGGYPIPFWGPGIALPVRGPEMARTKIRELADKGADVIKIAITSGGRGQWPILSLSEIQAIADEAHRLNLRVTAHVDSLAELKLAVEGGVDEAAHMVGGSIPDSLIDRMVARGFIIVPTLSAFEGWAREYRFKGQLEAAAYREERLRDSQRNLKRFIKAGGKVALGSDVGNPNIPYGMPIMEMELMKAAGMSPVEILLSATIHGADAIGQSKILGTIKSGKKADIIIVEGNPLENISKMKYVVIVIKDGKVVKQ